MRTFIHAMALLALFAFSFPAAAVNPPPAFEGRRLFVSYCQLCHGTGGKGDGPLAKAMNIRPADLTTTVRSRSDTILTKIITGEGRQTITGRDRHNLLSDSMPEWKDVFSESQVDALIAYLRFLGSKKHDLMGDPEVGIKSGFVATDLSSLPRRGGRRRWHHDEAHGDYANGPYQSQRDQQTQQ